MPSTTVANKWLPQAVLGDLIFGDCPIQPAPSGEMQNAVPLKYCGLHSKRLAGDFMTIIVMDDAVDLAI
jgi:hypothetical protein